MTIVVKCDEALLVDVIEHLRTLVDVVLVEDLEKNDLIERELALIKVQAQGEDIARIMQIVEVFRASIAGMGHDHLTIEMAGPESKVDAIISLLRPFGIIETARTGRVAIEHHEEIQA
jgi:acetolactate synthase-1/3 small subunit